jgi:hypothetical protein
VGRLEDEAAAVAVGVALGSSVPVGYLSTEISNAAVVVAVADRLATVAIAGLVIHAMAVVALPARSAVPLLAADPSSTGAGWLPMVVVALDPLV